MTLPILQLLSKLTTEAQRTQNIAVVVVFVARDNPTSQTADERYWRPDKIEEALAEFEDNFRLSPTGRSDGG